MKHEVLDSVARAHDVAKPGLRAGDLGASRDYRPDIDGLRAIAVLSVMLFHIDKRLVPGGFVGVDIFFVISGYLISHNIIEQLSQGRFSILEFYRRRVKRIAPALLLVVAATLAVSQQVLRPVEAERVAESALWSLASLANVYFWWFQDTGYFAAANSEIPLLHLWSLGVEEQFYLLWPLLLLLCVRPKRYGALVIWAGLAALGSFMFAEYFFPQSPAFVYYMLPTRFGELLAGAVIALLVSSNRKLPQWLIMPAAVTGLLLLVGSLWLLSEDSVFPGWLAIPPTLGTAILILAGHSGRSWLTRCLAFPPMVWVGLISYSAYLWHWPLLAFFRYGHAEVSAPVGVVAFFLTLLLAWLSYKLVEQPARRARGTLVQVFARQYCVPAGCLAVLSVGAMKIDGYGLRWWSAEYHAKLEGVREQGQSALDADYVCQRQRLTVADLSSPRCIVGEHRGEPNVLLWGDSQAAHYVGMMGAFANSVGAGFRNLEVGACPPILVDPKDIVDARRLANCRASAELVDSILPRYSVVVISATWSDYARQSESFLPEFVAMVRSLAKRGQSVILIGKVPIVVGYDARCREKELSYPGLQCRNVTASPGGEVAEVNAALADVARNTANVGYFDPTPFLCPGGVCSALQSDGKPIYFDRSHLTLATSWALGNAIVAQIGVPEPFANLAGWSSTPSASP